MKYLIILLVGLASGYLLYPAFNPNSVETKLSPEKTAKFQNFIDQEAKAFALMQDAPLVAEKAAVTKSSPVAAPESAKKEKTDQERYDQYRMAHYLESLKGKSKRLIGSFKGTLKHQTQKNKGRIDTVLMTFNLQQEGKTIIGDSLVAMSDANNDEYSRNAGNGGNRAIKNLPQDEDSYYVDASPSSYFLINLKSFPQVSGQYFEKWKFIGNVNLRKIDGPL